MGFQISVKGSLYSVDSDAENCCLEGQWESTFSFFLSQMSAPRTLPWTRKKGSSRQKKKGEKKKGCVEKRARKHCLVLKGEQGTSFCTFVGIGNLGSLTDETPTPLHPSINICFKLERKKQLSLALKLNLVKSPWLFRCV